MPNIIPAGWFVWLAENLMRASATIENPDTAQWTVTPVCDQNDGSEAENGADRV
jgi:hypothetical protein